MEGKWFFCVWLLQWHLCTYSRGRQVGRPLERGGGHCRASRQLRGWGICPQFRRLELDPWIGEAGGRRLGSPTSGVALGRLPLGSKWKKWIAVNWAGQRAREPRNGGTRSQGTGWTAKACDQSADPSLTTCWLWDLDSLLISLHFCFVVVFYLLSHVRLFCDPMDCSPPGSSFVAFSRQEYWSGLPCPPPGDLPNPGI